MRQPSAESFKEPLPEPPTYSPPKNMTGNSEDYKLRRKFNLQIRNLMYLFKDREEIKHICGYTEKDHQSFIEKLQQYTINQLQNLVENMRFELLLKKNNDKSLTTI